MRTLIEKFVFMGSLLVLGGCVTNPVLHRASADRSEEILYLSPFLAITKNHQGRTNSQWMYTIVQAHWANETPLPAFTGDTDDKYLVNSVQSLAESKSKGLLFGRGFNPNPEGQREGLIEYQKASSTPGETNAPAAKEPAPENNRPAAKYFVMTYDRVLFFRTTEELSEYSQATWGISPPELRPVEVFFEKKKRGPWLTGKWRTWTAKLTE